MFTFSWHHRFFPKEASMVFSKPGDRADVYTRVTDQIIQAIEAGTATHTMPWHVQEMGLPINALTGKMPRD
jgi:antirestriction protein ArdC